MAPPAAWRGSPVPHQPSEPAPKPARTTLFTGLAVAAVVAVAIAALVLSPDHKPAEDASATPSAPIRSPVTDPPVPPSSQPVTSDLLGMLNVQPNDIGSSWTQVAATALAPDTGECLYPTDGVQATHLAAYALLLDGQHNTIRGQLISVATVFVDDAAAVHQEGVDGSVEQGECYRHDGDAQFDVAGGGTAVPGTIAPHETGVTPPSLGWRYETTFTGLYGGGEVTGYLDYVLVRRGRVRLALALMSFDRPFDPALKELLISRVTERIAQTIKAED
jgi:hypothetical protein